MAKTDPTLRLDSAWIYKVSVLADKVARRVSRQVSAVSGLNHSQWRVLAAVADKPGRTASDVVAITPMDKGIVSRATAKLVKDGLVRREVSANDARSSLLFMTEQGEQTYSAIRQALSTSGADGLSVMSAKDRKAFLAHIDAVIEGYSED